MYVTIKNIMQQFEAAYESETGLPIPGRMQNAWRNYMIAHLGRVAQFASIWVGGRLEALSTLWYAEALAGGAATDAPRALYAISVLQLIAEHFRRLNSNNGLTFDISIFT